jgi:hypothetical protein
VAALTRVVALVLFVRVVAVRSTFLHPRFRFFAITACRNKHQTFFPSHQSTSIATCELLFVSVPTHIHTKIVTLTCGV